MGKEHNAEVDLDIVKAIFNTAATAVASLYLATGSVTVAMTGIAVSAAITSWVIWVVRLARPRSGPPRQDSTRDSRSPRVIECGDSSGINESVMSPCMGRARGSGRLVEEFRRGRWIHDVRPDLLFRSHRALRHSVIRHPGIQASRDQAENRCDEPPRDRSDDPDRHIRFVSLVSKHMDAQSRAIEHGSVPVQQRLADQVVHDLPQPGSARAADSARQRRSSSCPGSSSAVYVVLVSAGECPAL
jgi:hypothetical protein